MSEKDEHNYYFPLSSFQSQGKTFIVLGYLTEKKKRDHKCMKNGQCYKK